jgi:ATP-binding protein involved in chromosome partitioning
MFTKALKQLFDDVNWGAVDYCIIDMPPGTGDAAISLSQMVKLSGAVVVTTPQEVAMADVRKSINMLNKVNIPIIGLVENMSGFVTPEGQTFDIFGKGGGEMLSKKFSLPLLSSIPIDLDLRSGGDSGVPLASQNETKIARIFNDLAMKVVELVENNRETIADVAIVN